MQIVFECVIESKTSGLCAGKHCVLTKQLVELFSSVMDILNCSSYNIVFRDEAKETMELRSSPFGTPVNLSCQYTSNHALH